MDRRSLLCSFAALPAISLPRVLPRSPIARERKPGIDYAKAGETPDWERQRVIDLNTGRELELDCVEVDCVDGWALCWRRPPLAEKWLGKLGPYHEKVIVRGRFRLELIE